MVRRRGPGWLLRQGGKYFSILLSPAVGRALTGPVSFVLILSYRCTHRCVMCDFPVRARADVPEMSTGEARGLIREAAGLPASGVSFYGGEPLLRHDLPELIAQARELGLATHLPTNGHLLDRRTAFAVVGAGIDLVTVSLDGSCAETHDRQRGAPGAFQRAVEAIRNVKEARESLAAGTRLAAAMTITPGNLGEMVEVMNLARGLGADSFTVFEAQEVATLPNRFSPAERQRLLDVNRELRGLKRCQPEFIDNTDDYLDLTRKILSGETARLKCFAPYTDLFLDPYGNVYPCNYYLGLNRPIMKYRPGNLRALWYSREYRRRRLELAHCGRCNYLCHRELSLIFNRGWPFRRPPITLPPFSRET